MDAGLLIARLIHVVGGVLWVGSMFFLVVFLTPAVGDVGPDGGKVMGALMRRKLMVFTPVVAILTVLSGLYLYGRVSAGFDSAYMSSGPGMTSGLGAVAAILSFIVGVVYTRPAMANAMALSQRMANADPAERQDLAAQIEKYRSRGTNGGKLIIAMLLIAAVAMAVGRYVQ
jgi:uncharacterized membrane protein